MVLVILFSTFIDGLLEFLTGILDAPFELCDASAHVAHHGRQTATKKKQSHHQDDSQLKGPRCPRQVDQRGG